MHHAVRKCLMVVAAAATVTTLIAGPASADPGITYPGSAPYATAPIAGMGSDTTQTVENGLAAKASTTLGAPKFESWDAVNPTTGAKHDSIKSNYRRANGSTEGQAAISRAFDGGAWPKGCGATGTTTLAGKIQYARSSSGPKVPGTAGNSQLTFIPFARDAVSYAFNGTTGTLGSMSLSQIQGVYLGTITKINGITMRPYLPQAGSGTRSFFLTKVMGLTTEPAFWATLPTTEENDANVISVVGRMMPFSAANWIAQKNGKQVNHTGTAKIGSPNGVAPTFGTAPTLTPHIVYFANTTFGRDVYNVVTTASVTPGNAKFNSNLYKLFVNSGSGSPALRKWDTTTTSLGFSTSTAGVNGSTTLKGNLVANPTSLATC